MVILKLAATALGLAGAALALGLIGFYVYLATRLIAGLPASI
jgi:hypothetical protein